MDKKSGSNKSPESIRIEMDRSRERLERDLRGLRYELDFPRKIRRSFQQQTVVWISAAIAVGAILVLLPRRKKNVYVDVKGREKPKKKLVEAGFLLGALRIAAPFLRPIITDLIKQQFRSRRPASKW